MLDGKVIVVIGANGLLGREFVRAIREYGGVVVESDIENSECDCDITKKSDILNLIDFAKEKYGKIDGVVNSAYPRNRNYGKKFEDVEYEDFCENVDLHLGGYFLATQQFAEFFKSQGGGNIVNIASIYGVIPPRFDIYEDTNITMPIEYDVIKHGVISMVKYVAKYYKGNSIRVNAISPAGIYNNQDEKFIEKYNRYALNKGMLDREDISGTLIFLLSDMSRYINGQNIIVDDGWSL